LVVEKNGFIVIELDYKNYLLLRIRYFSKINWCFRSFYV
jgi:hypothetical protein